MSYIFLAIFIISSGLHLYASFKKIKPFRNVTKGWMLLSLMGWYVSISSNPSWLIILALLFSWLGDVFLIPKGTKWFVIGGIAFWISHFLFIFGYCELTNFANVNIWWIIGLGLIDLVAVVLVFSKLKALLPKLLFYPMFLYLLTNGAMNCFAWFMFIANGTVGTLITAIAAFFFFVSDSSLFFVRFSKDVENRSHFVVMLTYLISEFFITFGLIL